MKPLSQIPGYARASKRAGRLQDHFREIAFLGETEKLCGVTVVQTTLRVFAELSAVRSPFLVGGDIGGEDVTLFLWRHSPMFTKDDHPRLQRFVAFVRAIAFEKDEFRKSVRCIRRFLSRMLLDAPPASGSGGESDTSFVAAIVHQLASAYGWDRNTILDTPMPQIFQYLRLIMREKNPQLPKFNPLKNRITKKIMAKALAEAEAAAKAKAC